MDANNAGADTNASSGASATLAAASASASASSGGALSSQVQDDNQPAAPDTSAPQAKNPPAAETTPNPKPGTRPYEAMLGSTAYGRLRAEHPVEFEPASVFFTHDDGSDIDRRNSLRVKAALVYEVVTGRHADDDHMPRATRLLLTLAEKCHSRIHSPQAKDAPAPQTDVGAGGTGTGTGTVDAGDEAGWDGDKMRVLDGIFLVVGFLPKLDDAITSKYPDRDSVDESFKTRHMVEMVTDVIKLENQLLRLQDLLDVARHIRDVIWETVGDEQQAGTAAGFQFQEVKESMTERLYKPADVTAQNLGDVIHRFCWYYSPFFSTAKKTGPAPADDSPFKDVAGKPEMAARTLLDCLHMSVVKPAHAKGSSLPGGPARMPTARDLRRSGVRLQASDDGRAEIEFAQQQRTVWLPALVFDFKLATVARNLLAREYEEQSKPITRYFQMMNEVVEEAADVRILRRAGVIRGGGSSSRGGQQEVHELIKNIDGHATYPSVYMAMDREIDKVRDYHGKRMANFFVRNRPGVIWASSVAAVSLAAIVATRRKRG